MLFYKCKSKYFVPIGQIYFTNICTLLNDRLNHYLPKTLTALRVLDTFALVEKRAKKPIHIGNLITARVEQIGLSPKVIQKRMKISKGLYYYYLDKPTMDTGMLERFGEAIGVNFFLEYISESEKGGKAAEILREQLQACEIELRRTKDKLMDQYEKELKVKKRA